jgi:cytochrome c oxidase cbb3-type subunit III
VNGRQQVCALVGFGAVLLAGCAAPHGQPLSSSEVLAPNQIQDFTTLYSDNCAGCHGENGRGGAAIALADPVYLAISDKQAMHKVISGGMKGTSMPAFAESAGGLLTDQQIDIITQQIGLRWSKPGILDGANPPSYAAKSAGDTQRGAVVYQTFCQSCHGVDGRGGPKGSSITNDSFLALISDQELRTIVIAGRPELGAPDWRGDSPGKPMSDQDVTDIVAWLASRRSGTPGQPYSASNYGSH